MKNLCDINGFKNGEQIIAIINEKNYSYNNLIEFFNKPISENELNNSNLFRYFIYINLFNDYSVEYKENKYLINSLFFQKIDEILNKNLDIKNQYLNFKLETEKDELKQAELKLAIENKDYLIIDNDLLEIFDNLKYFLEQTLPNINNKYNNEIAEFNSENNNLAEKHSELKWMELSLNYFKLLHNLFILCILIKE